MISIQSLSSFVVRARFNLLFTRFSNLEEEIPMAGLFRICKTGNAHDIPYLEHNILHLSRTRNIF